MQARKQRSSLPFRPIDITHLTPLLLYKNQKTQMTPHHTTPYLKYRKYHFPPPTIKSVATYVPPSSINPHILPHTFPQPVDIMFSWALVIGPNTVHSSYLPTYTPLFITITYKSHNIYTILIAIKNNHHNFPPITYTSQTYHLFP